MKKQQTGIFILLTIAGILLFGCEGVAELFHGPKPVEPQPDLMYTVTYNGNGAGGTAPAAQTVNAGTAITVAGEGSLSLAGKTFYCWNTSANGSGTSYPAGDTITVNSNIVLYAQWATHTSYYMVTYYANGASGDVPPAQGANTGTAMTLAGKGSLSYSGKTFTGWNTAANGTGTPYAAGALVMLSSNIDLYAQWTTDPTTYTVTYNANGASGTAPTEQTVNAGTVITVKNQGGLTYSGKTFTGWNTATNGTGTPYAAGASVTVNSSISLYAQWTVITYTVTYYANGAGGTVPQAQPANAGATITVAGKGGLNYPDKTFTGWNTNQGGGGTPYTAGASLVVNSNTSLYAQWIPVLSPPTGITAEAQSSSSITISWNPVSGAASYNVYRLTTESGTYEKINSSIGTSYTDTGLNPSTTYYYKVSTINAGNDEGDKSSAISATTSDIVISGATLAAKLAWLQANAVSNTAYRIELTFDESISSHTFSYSGKNNIRLTITGLLAVRTISCSYGSLFTVGSGVTLILNNNITLQGSTYNTASLVKVNSGGSLEMWGNTKITGNTFRGSSNSSYNGGGVYVAGGSFTMNGSSLVSGNTVTYIGSGNNSAYAQGGGVYVASGSFIMNESSSVAGNTVTATNTSSTGDAVAYGGGVYVAGGSFIMNGSSSVSGNAATATNSGSGTTLGIGGGVKVGSGIFRISGGTIYGNGNDAATELKNTISSSIGAAMYGSGQCGYYNGEVFYQNGTLSHTNSTIRVVDGVLQQ